LLFHLIDNNILLSPLAIRDWSEGGAFVHNLIGGQIELRKVTNRFTPYHLPHSTDIKGLRNIYNGDNRFFNNVFTGGETGEILTDTRGRFWGLHGYSEAGFANSSAGNVYFSNCKLDPNETDYIYIPGESLQITLKEEGDAVHIFLVIPEEWADGDCKITGPEQLGMTIVSEAAWENPDGSPLLIDMDYFQKKRDGSSVVAGPFRNVPSGKQEIRVW
jgi:hypothetical protein